MALADFFRSLASPFLRSTRAPPGAPTAAPSNPPSDLKDAARATVQKIRTAWLAGRFHLLPWLDPYTDETDEIRQHYAVMLREPVLQAAVLGQVSAVASQDAQVHADDPDDPRQAAAAKAALHALKKVHGGSDLVPIGSGTRHVAWSVLSGAVIKGWSLAEVTLRKYPERHGPAKGKVIWETLKAKDTDTVQLVTDRFWGISGVKALRYNPGVVFEGRDLHSFVVFNRFSLYEHPIGISAFRSCYRAFWIKDTAIKLRALHLDRFTHPYFTGTYTSIDQKAALEEALEEMRGAGWATVPAGGLIQALDIAGRGTADFESAIRDCNEEMLTGVCGAYLHMMTGGANQQRGSSDVQQETTELFQWALSAALGDTVTAQMLAPWYAFNYTDMEPGIATWGAVSEQALQARANLDKTLQEIGLALSKKEAYSYFGRQRPADRDDELGSDQGGGGGGAPPPGGPGGGGGAPGQPPGGGDQGGAGQGGGGDDWASFGERPGDWHAPWEDLSCFAESDWVAWTLKSGPRKGMQVWKNTVSGKLSDHKPGGKKKPAGGEKKPPAKKPTKPPPPGKLTLDAAHAHVQGLIDHPPADRGAAVKDVVARLSTGLTGNELADLAKRLGLTGGGSTKEQKAQKLLDKALAGPKPPKGKKPPVEKKPPVKPPVEEKRPPAGKVPPFEPWKPGDDSSGPAHLARVAAFNALPPGRRGGAGGPLRGLMRDEYSAMKQLKEFEDGVVKVPALYRYMKADLPSLTPEEFRAEVQQMAGQEGPEGRAQLHSIERPREAGIDTKGGDYHDPDGVMPRRGDEVMGNLIWPEPKAGQAHPAWKPPGAEKKPPEKVEPPPPPPKPPEPGKPGRPQPHPPEPGFTGVDTLGRHWQDGELVPGKVEPPKGRPGKGGETVTVTPGRTLRLADIAGGAVPKLSDTHLADLETLGLLRGGGLYQPYTDSYSMRRAGAEEIVGRLVRAGVFEESFPGMEGGPKRLTAPAVAALVARQAGTDALADPRTKKGIKAFVTLFAALKDADKQRVLDHLGVKEDAPYYPTPKLEQELTDAALRHANGGKSVAERVRDAADLHDAVARLGGLAPRFEQLRDERKAILAQLPANIGTAYDASALDWLVQLKRQKLASKKATGKKQLAAELEAMERVLPRLKAVEAEMDRAAAEPEADRHEKVSALLRERVKEPAAVTVRHSPEVGPQGRADADRAAELLKGVLQRAGHGRPLPAYTTYRAVAKDGTPDDRAHHTHDHRINMPEKAGVTVGIHEIVHGIEDEDPALRAAVHEFLAYRVGDEAGVDLQQKFGGNYDPGEMGRKDHFELAFGKGSSHAYYTGKQYAAGNTELLTMGVQKLYEDPSGFARRDPEFCTFILGMLDGSLRSKPLPEE